MAQNHSPAPMYDYPPPPQPSNSYPLRPETMYPPPQPGPVHSPSYPNSPYYPPGSQYPPSQNPLYNHQPSPYDLSSHPQHPAHPPHPAHPSHPPGLPTGGPYIPGSQPMSPPMSQPMSQQPMSQQPMSQQPMSQPMSHSMSHPMSQSIPLAPYDHPPTMPPTPYNPNLLPHQQPVITPNHSYPFYPQRYPPHNIPPRPSYMSEQFKPVPQRIQTAQVKLEISAKGLRDRDLASKSDPTCVVFVEEKTYNPYGVAPTAADGEASYPQNSAPIQWRELARTECIKNNLNPHFKVQIPVPYHFEEIQNLRFGLWDIDSGKTELSHHDFLGEVRTTLGELVTAGVWTAKLTSSNAHDLKNFFGGQRDLGTISVIVHENRDGGQLLIKASMSGHKLDRKDWLSSDPFFIVTQVGASSPQSRSQLYESEVVRKNLNPVWRPFQIKPTLPKGGGKQQITLEFLVYDKDRHRKNDEIGKVVCSVAQLETGTTLAVINEKKKKRRKYQNSGTLKFSKFRAINMPSLVDYLQGGLKLHFSVAVDLTRSNGDPSEPLSLHYRQDVYGNHYIRALTAIANILRVYTPSDNLFAAFGFGAELPGRPGFTSACFPLGLDASPHCHGIEGVLAAYNVALNNVKLSGPTFFAPIIDEVARSARKRPNSQTNQNYDVLLILTDGVVSDFDATVDRIITASKTVPLSIIIIGIGNRDFKKMRDLDHDDGLLKSRDGTRQADRDICQFVAFKEYEHAPPERLGSAVLQELPENIVEYFVGACDPPITPGQRPVMPPLNG